VHVEQNKVHIFLADNPQGLFSIAGRKDAKPARLEYTAKRFTKRGVVVGD
jgi:hypothetical protein